MNLRERWDRFWHPAPVDTQARVILSKEEASQATRLSKLTGRTRDEVLREAYKKSDAMLRKDDP